MRMTTLATNKWEQEIIHGERFRFGQNWKDFIGDKNGALQLDVACECLANSLFRSGIDTLRDISFLDIGCGSGLHSAAAIKLGAKEVIAIDYDQDSVECTKTLLKQLFGDTSRWQTKQFSILDSDSLQVLGQHDIVYSWGVLHHTGDLDTAIKNAAGLVKPNGYLFISLYYPTFLDFFWKREKRFYSKASKYMQRLIRSAWILKTRLSFLAKRRSFSKMVSEYREARGMDYFIDVHDWLGGYPYEPISESACIDKLEALEFTRVYSESLGSRLSLSSACNEFIFRKSPEAAQ